MAGLLTLLSQAADGKTYDEMRKVLHLNANKTEIADQFSELWQQLQQGAGKLVFSMVNQIYVQQDFKLNTNFQEISTKKFDAGVESVDFSKAQETAQAINHFVEEKTKNKIKDAISSDTFENVIMVLLNVISFDAKWEIPFEGWHTEEGDFFLSRTDTVSVRYMKDRQKYNFAVLDDLDATALEMKYAGSDYSFVIILPNTITGLRELETRLKDYDLAKIDDQMSIQELEVFIPKFEVKFQFDVNAILQKV